METLNSAHPLPYHKRTADGDQHYPPTQLKPLVVSARTKLAQALDSRFFSRYTDTAARMSASFIYEMQLFLHPQFKSLDNTMVKAIFFCNEARGVSPGSCRNIADAIKAKVLAKVKKLMLQVATTATPTATDTMEAVEPNTAASIPADLLSFFGCASDHVVAAPVDTTEARVEEELLQWQREPSSSTTSVLAYWKERADANDFKYLPVVAKIVYAVPMSSAQIERDFGLCGRMVTPHRTSLSASKIDMAAFISCNREYLDLGQCEKIAPAETAMYIPSHILVGVLEEIDDEMAVQLQDIFSASSFDEEMKE
jgi:hypothetical protein